MKHALDTTIAKDHGVNVALLIENFQFWTAKNLQRNHHIHDGLCWSYDTLDSLCEAFPYWTRRQVEHAINNAMKAGLLKKGNYNQTKYDRTLWYALTPDAYQYYPGLLSEKYLAALYSSISQNCEIDFTIFVNRFHKNVTPIPDTIPDTDPYIKPYVDFEKSTVEDEDYFEPLDIDEKSGYKPYQTKGHLSVEQPHDFYRLATKSDYQNNQTKKEAINSEKEHPSHKDALFQKFYSKYPNKQKPHVAYKAFRKLKPSPEFTEMLILDVSTRIEKNWKGRDKSKIPHPSTYLNSREWEGEYYSTASNSSAIKPRYTVDSVMGA